LSFNKRPYFVKVDYIDTVTLEDISNGTAGDKVVKTNADGKIPIGIIPAETATKVRTLNGLVNEVSISGTGLIQISSTQVGSSGTITISSLPPVFYPVVVSRYVATSGLTFTQAETSTYKTGASVAFSTSHLSDIQLTVTGKYSGSSIQHYTPRLSLNGSSYELPIVSGDMFSLSYIFPSIPTNPLLTGQVLLKATPVGSTTGTVTITNVSLSITALPRIV